MDSHQFLLPAAPAASAIHDNLNDSARVALFLRAKFIRVGGGEETTSTEKIACISITQDRFLRLRAETTASEAKSTWDIL